jgi:membrane protein DedA with SNARE-associated domain
LEQLLEDHGYVALLMGTFLEGETAILLASSLIHQGIFSAGPTIVAGFAGSFISDWIYYLIGRINGQYFIDRRPKLKLKVEPVRVLFQRHQMQILFSYRFLYGFRVIIPVVIGMSCVKPLHFLFFSVISGIIWATVVSTAGYLVGKYFQIDVELFEKNILLIAAGFATFGILVGYVVTNLAGRAQQKELLIKD